MVLQSWVYPERVLLCVLGSSLFLAAALIFHTRQYAGTTYAPLLFRSKTTYYIWTSIPWPLFHFTLLFLLLYTLSMDITAPQFRNRFIHTRYQALRKCCGCIHLRVGAGISCLIWMVDIFMITYTAWSTHIICIRDYPCTLLFYHFKTRVASIIHYEN